MKSLILLLITTGIWAGVNVSGCMSCHGTDWSSKALGVSKDVSKMTKQEVSDALVGYKNGSYGGQMKNLMRDQIYKYSVEDLNNTGIGI